MSFRPDSNGRVTSRCGRAGSSGAEGRTPFFPCSWGRPVSPAPLPRALLHAQQRVRHVPRPPNPSVGRGPSAPSDPPGSTRSRESPRLAGESPRPPAPGSLWSDLPFLLVVLLPGPIAAHAAPDGALPVPHTQRPDICVVITADRRFYPRPLLPACTLLHRTPQSPHESQVPPSEELTPAVGTVYAGPYVTAALQVQEVGLRQAQLTLPLGSSQGTSPWTRPGDQLPGREAAAEARGAEQDPRAGRALPAPTLPAGGPSDGESCATLLPGSPSALWDAAGPSEAGENGHSWVLQRAWAHLVPG